MRLFKRKKEEEEMMISKPRLELNKVERSIIEDWVKQLNKEIRSWNKDNKIIKKHNEEYNKALEKKVIDLTAKEMKLIMEEPKMFIYSDYIYPKSSAEIKYYTYSGNIVKKRNPDLTVGDTILLVSRAKEILKDLKKLLKKDDNLKEIKGNN